MFYAQIQQADTLKNAADSLKTAAVNNGGFQSVSFNFSKITGDSLILSVLGYTIVFLALLFLFLTFTYLTKILNYNIKKRLKEAGKQVDGTEELSISGETSAAISAALFLHFREVHDFENTVITIKKVQKRYSPWSSKIYGLREYPKK